MNRGLLDSFAAKSRAVFERLGVPLTASDNPKGIRLTVGGYFAERKYAYPYYWTIPEPGMLAGGIGPPVIGGSCSRVIFARSPLIAERFLRPLIPLLKTAKYIGVVEADAVVDDLGDARAVGARLEMIAPGALASIASGGWESGHNGTMYLAELRVYRPMTPLDPEEPALGRGETPQDAYFEAMAQAISRNVPNICYRNDCGQNVKKLIGAVKEAGWLK